MSYLAPADVIAIVAHHSASPSSWDLADIDREHKIRGFRKVGYHRVYGANGTVEYGRLLTETGAHAKASGYNSKSIGVCFVGSFEGDNVPTEAQWDAGVQDIVDLCRRFHLSAEDVLGHNEVPGASTLCPGFDPEKLRKSLRAHGL